ncbi:TPA: APC family permease [Clostridioides difficile]|uniref:APC family permease n=1 Tax=Clostridioides difficile TaxID=1496 RepID=UPI000AAFBC42|nr:APC family permease [Clostridioides difficile]AXU71133.1 amino acid permease [Clostridioides difficile]
MNEKNKMGLISIILLGINAVVGAGVFLLPGDAMKSFGVASIFVYIFDMLLVLSMAFCFAEVAGKFNKNGAAYVYTKEAFGDFCGFEVGLMKWVIGCISWGALIVGFPTSLSAVWAPAGEPHIQKIIIVAMIVGLTIINLLGVSLSKIVQNVITVGKLIPLILFIGIGIFFIKGVNFTSSTMVPPGAGATEFGAAALLMFYSFTGFESIAVAAEDMENPQKNIPIAIISVIVIASIIYILNQVVCVGILGDSLSSTSTPVADAARICFGNMGAGLVTFGTLVSVGGICMCGAFVNPRSCVALADDKMLPRIFARKDKKGTPYVAIISTMLITIPIALSGSFAELAAISAVARFIQYIPTSLSVLVFRKKRPELVGTFKTPFGAVIPLIAVCVGTWLLFQASMHQLIMGLGALAIGVPLYFIMKSYNRKVYGENLKKIV